MLRIQRERLRKGLTQRQAADRAGIGFDNYRKLEQGRYVPGPMSPMARKVEAVYGLRLQTLLADVH